MLDARGHHSATCKVGEDVEFEHDAIRDWLAWWIEETTGCRTKTEEYVKAWRSHKTSFGCGAYLTIAWRLERAGDCYAACGMVVEACRCYLEARAEVARLGLEPEEEEEGKKKKKAGGGGAVSEDGRAGAIEAKLRAMLCGGSVEVT